MADKTVILIDEEEFGAWPSVDIKLALDGFSTVEFTAPFEADRAEFRETFRPFSFKSVEVRVSDDAAPVVSVPLGPLGAGDRLFTGFLLGVDPEADATKSVVGVTAYSLPAVFQDCNAPGETVPIEFEGLTLEDIAQKLVEPFNIRIDFQADRGAVFSKAKLEVEQKIFDFLAELGRQRNLVLSNTADGDLLFHQSIAAGKPVARLKEGEQPVTKVKASFSPQSYFSEITGFTTARKARKGQASRKGSKHTEQNPRLSGILRPHSFKLPDTEDGGAPEAVRAKLGRMFGNMAAFTVDIATWRDPDGALWAPNTTVTLLAPDSMVYVETEFIVRTVTLHEDPNTQTAKLGLVLPGAFSGEVPESFPWDA